MSRLEVQSAPLYVAKRTDPVEMSENFYYQAKYKVQGHLSRHTLSTIGERMGLTDEEEILGWLDTATGQRQGSLWTRWSVDEVVNAIRRLVRDGVSFEYALTVTPKYDLLQDQLRISQLCTYKVPAEYAAVASMEPWSVYSVHMMHEAGVPAEYTIGWDTQRVKDTAVVKLYEHGVPLDYAQKHAWPSAPMRAAALWAAAVPGQYIDRLGEHGLELNADDIILLHKAGCEAQEARELLGRDISPAGVALVLRDGIPMEYARALA